MVVGAPDEHDAARPLPGEAVVTAEPAENATSAEAGQPTPLTERRRFLQTAGAGLLAGALVAGVPEAAQAQDAPLDPTQPAMRRTPGWVQAQDRAVIEAATPAEVAGVATAMGPELIALNRMAFGTRKGDLEAMLALGPTPEARLLAYVNQQLAPMSIDDSACNQRIAAQGFTTLGKSRTQLWQDHVTKPNIDWSERTRPLWETIHATFLRAVYTKRQLFEVLADFWHNNFNVYGGDIWAAGTWVHTDRDVIRANLFGNFRTMLHAVARSPAMLYYLDNIQNTSAGPNENYARECFEIHTMGAENYMGVASTVGPGGQYRHPAPTGADGKPLLYVDEDVYAATQCFTGWRIHKETGDFVFDDSVHEKYSKIVLAQLIPSGSGIEDGNTVLDMLANHPGTARHIARKLCRRLISDDPPESIVNAAADVFYNQRAASDQLRQVVRTILLSEEFRTTFGQKIKRPFEFAVSAVRATNADFVYDDSFRWMYERMGQPLFGWRPPDGYPDRKENWSSTMPMLHRWRLSLFLTDRWRYGGDGANKDELRANINAQMPTTLHSATAIVDYWAQYLMGRALPLDERAALIGFMAGGRNPDADLPDEERDDRLRFLVGLMLCSPSFQWR
jgi:uncharacterized protein (DUF1800 family)